MPSAWAFSSHTSAACSNSASPVNHSQATREHLGSDPKGALMDTGSLLQPGQRLEGSETAEELVGALEVPERPLMSSGYADIYCGFWTNPQGERVQVAVKELRTLTPKNRRTEEEALKTKTNTRLKREVFVWSRTKHPNLHPFLGYCSEPKPRLISPWCRHGNLEDYLHAHPDLTRCDKLRFIYQTACGLEHLHSRAPPICHADIKPENILINDYHTATLSDFGLSRIVQDLEARSGFTTGETIKGTLRYMANELSAGEKPNLASDVYAFGGLILTVMSGKPPFDGLVHHVILRRVIQDQPPIQEDHPKLPPDDPLWKLMRRCWNYEPLARPTMGEVLLELLGQINHEESNLRSRFDLASVTDFNLDDVIDEDEDMVDVGVSTAKYGWTAPENEEDDDLDLDLHPAGRKPPVVKAPGRANKNAQIVGTEASAHYVTTQTTRQQPWFLRPDNDEKSILVNPDGGVRGGTLPALVERLTLHNYRDAVYNDTFLITFKSFTTVDELFELLVARFNIPEPAGLKPDEQKQWVEKKQTPIRFRVINILTMLMEGSVLEKEDMHILGRIREFASEAAKVALPAQQLIALVDRAENGEFGRVTKVINTSQSPPAILRKFSRPLKLMDVDPLEMSKQLTILESRMFMKIRPMECLSRAEGQGDGDNIRKIINMSNEIASWVAEQVLSKDSPRRRGAYIEQFIMIAERCREMNNFSSMAALLAGLNLSPIRRLKRTWEILDPRVTSQFDDLEKILDSGRNFKGYRQLLATIDSPCIPFLGVYLATLAFIQDANKDMLGTENSLINFGKRQKAAEVIREIKTYQSRPYNLTELPNVQDLIEKSLARVENSPDFWELSIKVEPRETETEKMARLLQESGFL